MSAMPSLAELRRRGLEILIRELGYVDTMRFLYHYDSGEGDYTRERQQLLPAWTVDEMVSEADRLVPKR
jgi:hypothetical protein